MMDLKINKLFFLSIFSSIILWFVIFLLLPVIVVEKVEWETVLFIMANYLSLILGFCLFNFKNSSQSKIALDGLIVIKGIILIVVISYLFRYIDLFFIRGVSFYNEMKANRIDSNDKSNIIFSILSVFKSLYFFPIVILLSIKKRPKKLLIISYLLLLLPLIEAFLKGTRKPFFEIFLILFLTVIIFDKIKITKQKIIIFIGSLVVLLIISNNILSQREFQNGKNDNQYNYLLNARYNDLLKPTDAIKKDFNNPEISNFRKKSMITALHIGQYYTHGFFELNHIIINADNLPISYGSYTFYTIPKFINKTGLFKTIDYTNPSPRGYVYITLFGGLYLDFRWFSVFIMFLFGAFQKKVFQKARAHIIWRPLLIYLIIINVFLCVYSHVRGAGMYPIVGFFLLLIVMKIISLKHPHEKSISA